MYSVWISLGKNSVLYLSTICQQATGQVTDKFVFV